MPQLDGVATVAALRIWEQDFLAQYGHTEPLSKLELIDVVELEIDGHDSVKFDPSINCPIGCRPHAWVVALTGDVTPEARQACRAAGMDAFLAKPVALASMAKCLQYFTIQVWPRMRICRRWSEERGHPKTSLNDF